MKIGFKNLKVMSINVLFSLKLEQILFQSGKKSYRKCFCSKYRTSRCLVISESFIHLSVLSAICISLNTSESLNHIYASRNPTPGILINRPNGSDVYKGVPKDYTRDVSVTVQIFVQEYKSKLVNKCFAAVFTFKHIV